MEPHGLTAVVPFSARRAESPEAKRRNNSSASPSREYAFCIHLSRNCGMVFPACRQAPYNA